MKLIPNTQNNVYTRRLVQNTSKPYLVSHLKSQAGKAVGHLHVSQGKRAEETH